MKDLLKKRPGASLLGLSFDGSRFEAVAARRTNGSVEIKQTLAASLSLDPLTNDPELVGREIRKCLDAAGIKERQCAVCVPQAWALTLQVRLPDLPEEDLESFLQIESERGFPYGVETLMVSNSRFRTPGGESWATLVAVSRDHVLRLENVLKAAQLKPVTFSLGISALQSPDDESSEGVLALVPGESAVGLQATSGGGVAALRAVDGAFEQEGSEKRLQADQVAREVRITLGQLPPDVTASLRRLRIFGRSAGTDKLAAQLRERAEDWGMRVELVEEYAPGEFSVKVPSGTAVSSALSLAVRRLAGQNTGFEFLPPKISAWKQITARYSSGKLAWTGATAGAVALIVALAFLVQQWQLWRWGSKWNSMKSEVAELEEMQARIKQYRPWFDESVRSLAVLKRLTEAFPENGAVSAKTVEIREPATVICSGTALDNQALLKMHDQLSAVREISDLHMETRGVSPLEFTLSFNWGRPGGP